MKWMEFIKVQTAGTQGQTAMAATPGTHSKSEENARTLRSWRL